MPQSEEDKQKMLRALTKMVEAPNSVFNVPADGGWGIALHILTKLCVKADVSITFQYETGWASSWMINENGEGYWAEPSRNEGNHGYTIEVGNTGSINFANPTIAIMTGYAILKEHLEEQCETDS